MPLTSGQRKLLRRYISDPEGFETAITILSGESGPGGPVNYGDLTNVPTTFAPVIGAGAGDAVAGNDARLTDTRTPTAHTHDDLYYTEAEVDALIEGVVADADLTAHVQAADPHPGYALDADLATHEGDADPHPAYQRESEKGAASGYASLDAGTKVPTAELGGAGADSTKFLRGDQSWEAIEGGSTPTGTGFRHVIDGAEDAASKLVETADISNDQVTYAKIQNVSATDKLLGRSTAGAGDAEEIACTAAGRALLDDTDASAQRTTLELGTAATTAAGDYATAAHNHDAAYEAKNANIQAHIAAAHAPSDAQKNSDITLAEIEAKLVGEIDSHSHAGGGAPDPHAASHQPGGGDAMAVDAAAGTGSLRTLGTGAAQAAAGNHAHAGVYEPADAAIQTHVASAHAPSNAQANADITLAEIEAKLTGEITSHTHPAGGGGDPAASQAEQEAGTEAAKYVAPATQQFHPSAAKFWCRWTGNSTTILASYNMTSIADTAVGDADGTIATDFGNANWCGQVTTLDATLAWNAANTQGSGFDAIAAGTFGVLCSTITDGGTAAASLTDPDSWHVIGFGDHA